MHHQNETEPVAQIFRIFDDLLLLEHFKASSHIDGIEDTDRNDLEKIAFPDSVNQRFVTLLLCL